MDGPKADRFESFFEFARLTSTWTRRGAIRLSIASALALTTLVGVLLLELRGLPAGVALLAASLVLLFAYLALWHNLVGRFYRHLATQSDWNPWIRVAILCIAFAVVPVVTLVAPAALMAILSNGA